MAVRQAGSAQDDRAKRPRGKRSTPYVDAWDVPTVYPAARLATGASLGAGRGIGGRALGTMI